MQNHLNLKVAVLLLFLLVSSIIVNAEVMPCNPKIRGINYTHPTYNYMSPPLLSNMPYDIMVSYIIVDSILKYSDSVVAVTNSFFKRFENNQISFDNDTLNYALKYMYRLADYDPLIYFYNFCLGSANKKVSPRSLHWDLMEYVRRKIPNGGRIRRVLDSPWILHIYVEETNMWCLDSTYKNLKDFTTVKARILDTIKGKKLPNLNTMFFAEELTSKENDDTSKPSIEINTMPNNVNLVFEYCNQWSRNYYGDDETIWHVDDNGNIICCLLQDEDGSAWVKPNREYIVLLAPIYECTHNGNFYYALWPTGGTYGYGMFKIENGIVLDKKNDWGWGNEVPVETFKQNLKTLINDMRNYGE